MLPGFSLRRFLLVSVCALVIPAALIGQLNTKTDGAFTTFQVEAESRFGPASPRQLTFVWYPELSPETAIYALEAQCSSQNRLGGPPETALRVAFKGSMVPLSTGTAYKLRKKRAKLLENGSQNRRVRWQDPVFADLAGQGRGDGVMIQMDIVLKGELSFGDVVTCEVGMSEAESRPIL